MNILIIGAKGQLGLSLRDAFNEKAILAECKHNNLFYTDIDLPSNDVNSYVLDITNAEQVDNFIKHNEIEIVVNCAAYTNVDAAQDNEQMADMLNNKAVEYLANICAKYRVLLIHISTDYVFDGTSRKPYVEDDKTNPLGVYGKTKLSGEKSVEKSGCNYIIIRTSWLYSKYGKNFVKTISNIIRERFKLSSKQDNNLPDTSIRLSRDIEPLKVVNDQCGSPTNALDLSYTIIAFIYRFKQNKNSIKETYHYSNSGDCTWFEFARAIEFCLREGKKNFLFQDFCHKNTSLDANFMVKPCSSEQFVSKVTRPTYSVLDKSKIQKDIGIEIPHWYCSLRKTIGELYE